MVGPWPKERLPLVRTLYGQRVDCRVPTGTRILQELPTLACCSVECLFRMDTLGAHSKHINGTTAEGVGEGIEGDRMQIYLDKEQQKTGRTIK